MYCLTAQARTYSGTINAQTNRGRRCSTNDIIGFCFGEGMLGWTEIHVHKNIVVRQLQRMFVTVRQCVRSVQLFDSNESLSRDVMGLASIDLEAP